MTDKRVRPPGGRTIVASLVRRVTRDSAPTTPDPTTPSDEKPKTTSAPKKLLTSSNAEAVTEGEGGG